MNVLVCIKHVPDTEARIKIAPDGQSLDFSGANWIISPYDEFAVEEAIRIREKQGGEVVVLTAGDEEASKSLRQALAMGADRAVLCDDPAFRSGGPLLTARALAAACGKQAFDLILCGKQGVGDDNQQVPTLLAETMGLPCVTVVTAIEYLGTSLRCTREIEGGAEVVKVPLPAVISCQKGLNEPRYPSLPNIMKAKKKELAVLKPADLGFTPPSGSGEGTFALKGIEPPPPKPQGRLIEGDADGQVRELMRLLSEEAKAI
jgi:electron transfer flavoprotein beta subunit